MIFGGNEKLQARINELEAENKRFREAPAFYADPENYKHGHKYKDLDDATIFKDEDAGGVDVDHGVKAMEALKGSST